MVGAALFLLLLFGIGAALTGSAAPGPHRHVAVRGTSLAAEPARQALRPIELPGTPPSDVLGSLVVPRGVRVVSVTRWNGLTQYDGRMRFSLAAPQAAVIDFFRAQLRARGWSISAVGPAHGEQGAVEVLAQRPSSDGWFWEVGAVVSPTAFPGAPATRSTSSAAAQDTTRFTVELFEVPDAT